MTFQYPTGHGRSHTHAKILSCGSKNSSKRVGEPYDPVSLPEIQKLALNPPSVFKDEAQWFIPSEYRAHDARAHSAQREKGTFRFLTLDVDKNNLSISSIDEIVSVVIGQASRIIYSTRSATETLKKWRVLVPLANPIAGADFADTQDAFYDLLEAASNGALIPDRALARPAQLVYLPNKGEFYQVQADPSKVFKLTPDHAIIRHREVQRTANDRAEPEAATASNMQMSARVEFDGVSLVDHFNRSHSVAGMLERYEYKRRGSSNDWRSPLQSSDSYATRDLGESWISLSASDAAQEIGAETKDGHRHGDAFDLFCYFEHGGDFAAALRAYVKEAGLGRQKREAPTTCQHSTLQLQKPTDHDPGVPSPRNFEALLDAAKVLEPGQIEEMEAIIAECSGLSPLRADAIFRAIKDATNVPLIAIRAQLSREREAIPRPDHLDLARMTLDEIGHQNILCAEAFVWRWQERGVWTQQDERAVKQAVQTRLDQDAMIDVTASLVNSVTDVLKSEIYRPEHKFNLGNPEAVNCLSGELELLAREWVLRPHCRKNYRTTQIPVAYDPQADAPMFRAFLAQVFRDDLDRDDKVQAVLELIGYTLMSHARHEKFIMLIGPGANGKSVLLAVLEGLLGPENVAGVQPANFDNRFQRAHLHQKLANIVTELKQGEVIADAELKAITSGEPGTVEHKHKNPFVMRPFATCWFGTNHMPHTRDFSEALFRRATILKFNRTFEKSEQDPQLKEKLQAELPGILNLSLTAYARAVGQGFTEPASSEEAKKEWRFEADQVASFVEDACHRDPGGRVNSSELFSHYKLWAEQNGVAKAVSLKGLRDRLNRLGFGADRDRNRRYVLGLRMRGSIDL